MYAITSHSVIQAAPAQPASSIRGHRQIEALHHIRDVSYAEPASQVRTANGSRVMATLRNLATATLKPAGHPASPPPAAITLATPPALSPPPDSARDD